MGVLTGHDQAVCDWAARRLGHTFATPYATIGWVDTQGRLRAAALLHGYYDHGNIDLGLVIDPPIAKGFIRAVAAVVFEKLQCSRITVHPPKSNSGAIEQLIRAGFKSECTSPDYYGVGNHALRLRMKKTECRWMT